MERVYMITVDDNEIDYCELTKKGYDFYEERRGKKDLDNYWGDWNETVDIEYFIDVLKKEK